MGMKWPFSKTQAQPLAATEIPKRVLLVENDKDLQTVYLTRLQSEGIEVMAIEGGTGLVQQVINYKPGLMILDLMLSDMDGLDALEEIRNNPQTANLKVIVVSAVSTAAQQDRALKLGVTEYMIKSQLVLDDMIKHIKVHLGMATASEANPYGV
jgi:DNA-binding response OmpR family regulator